MMGVTRTKTETVADAWAEDFGGVTVLVGGTQRTLEIAEACELRDLLDEQISRALEWAGTSAAVAAETRTR